MTAPPRGDDERSALLSSTAEQMAQVYARGIPAVLRPAGPLFEMEEVFTWIAAAHPPRTERSSLQKIQALLGRASGQPSPEREVDPGRPAELYRDGGLLLDATPYLPLPDETFEPWVSRVRDALGTGFGLQAPGVECASFEASHRLQTLLHPVLRQTGPRTYRYNIFFGDYPRTPFGFHIDPHQEAVFQYVVRGRRRACFWDGLSMDEDDAQWIEDSNGLTTPPHEPDLAFDLEPGDLVFWPGTFVHGMEPEGPSMGVSMVIDRASPRRRDQVVSSLETITSGGQSALPPMTEVEMLVPGTRYRRRGVFPAAYERLGEVLIIGVGGRTFDWPDPASAAATMQLIDVLNAQDEIDVDQVLARCSGGALSHDMACEVLVLFEGLGYFVREPG